MGNLGERMAAQARRLKEVLNLSTEEVKQSKYGENPKVEEFRKRQEERRWAPKLVKSLRNDILSNFKTSARKQLGGQDLANLVLERYFEDRPDLFDPETGILDFYNSEVIKASKQLEQIDSE